MEPKLRSQLCLAGMMAVFFLFTANRPRADPRNACTQWAKTTRRSGRRHAARANDGRRKPFDNGRPRFARANGRVRHRRRAASTCRPLIGQAQPREISPCSSTA